MLIQLSKNHRSGTYIPLRVFYRRYNKRDDNGEEIFSAGYDAEVTAYVLYVKPTRRRQTEKDQAVLSNGTAVVIGAGSCAPVGASAVDCVSPSASLSVGSVAVSPVVVSASPTGVSAM